MVDGLITDDGSEVDLKDQQRISVRNRAINSPIKVSDSLYVMPITGSASRPMIYKPVGSEAPKTCHDGEDDADGW
jgi:hypothetical protein